MIERDVGGVVTSDDVRAGIHVHGEDDETDDKNEVDNPQADVAEPEPMLWKLFTKIVNEND